MIMSLPSFVLILMEMNKLERKVFYIKINVDLLNTSTSILILNVQV